jgi:CubicO group peptidase (beta-lactamase class C family)
VASVVVIHDGRIRYERYGMGFDRDGRWTSFSVAKSITSTLVGAAIADGAIGSVDDPVIRYIPELTGSAYDGVTIAQLLTMTSGVAWNEDYEDPQSDVARFDAHRAEPGQDPLVSYMSTLQRAHSPGQVWHYSSGETNMIGIVVARATGRPLADYLSEKIWRPFGMEADATWLLDRSGGEIAGCCIPTAGSRRRPPGKSITASRGLVTAINGGRATMARSKPTEFSVKASSSIHRGVWSLRPIQVGAARLAVKREIKRSAKCSARSKRASTRSVQAAASVASASW